MKISASTTLTVSPKGDPGEPGPKGDRGPTLRGPQAWSDCSDGYGFLCGGDADEWKDVVLYKGNYYSCIKSHVKSADNYPGSPADIANGYWRLGEKLELVATKILLATYALVKNLGVESIDMRDENGDILFQAKDGNVTCKTGTFDGITVRNALIESGRIAGFTIDGDSLSNEPFTNDASITFRNDKRKSFAGIGGNVLPASSGARAVARFENHDESDAYGLGINYAALVSAQGARRNIALQFDGGAVSGLAMRNTLIDINTAALTLTRDDYNVVALNTTACVITLPEMQTYDDGHVVRIKRLGSGSLKIKMQQCYTYNGTAQRKGYPFLVYNQNSTLTGTDLLDVSSECDAMEFVWCRDISRTINGTAHHGGWLQYKFPRDW